MRICSRCGLPIHGAATVLKSSIVPFRMLIEMFDAVGNMAPMCTPCTKVVARAVLATGEEKSAEPRVVDIEQLWSHEKTALYLLVESGEIVDIAGTPLEVEVVDIPRVGRMVVVVREEGPPPRWIRVVLEKLPDRKEGQ